MNKFIIGSALVLCLFFISGCQTTKNTVTGAANYTYSIGKGVVEDVATPVGAVMAADQWFQENYW